LVPGRCPARFRAAYWRVQTDTITKDRRAMMTDVRVARVTEIIAASTEGFDDAIKKGFQAQLENRGFSLVEVLSNCNVNWRMEPGDAVKFVETEMVKNFPLGVYKDCWAEEKAAAGKADKEGAE